jgi:translocation and assembly module TamB
VTFAGDLDPVLDFAGTTQSQDIAITVSIAGQASDPEVTFSSMPELPQDEVLAHLIFNRGIGELSPVQIARLADAAAGLGGAGGGLLNQLRASTGLDDLDIVTDEEGAPALAAGRYVSENVYLGVQGGASGSSRVTIDLDITDDVKARAAVSPEGSSSIGVFFERDY